MTPNITNNKYQHWTHSLSKKDSVPITGPVVAQRVGRGIALLFHDHGTRRG